MLFRSDAVFTHKRHKRGTLNYDNLAEVDAGALYEYFKAIDNMCRLNKWSKVAVFPFRYEDEAASLFSLNIHVSQMDLYFLDTLDFADIMNNWKLK